MLFPPPKKGILSLNKYTPATTTTIIIRAGLVKKSDIGLVTVCSNDALVELSAFNAVTISELAVDIKDATAFA